MIAIKRVLEGEFLMNATYMAIVLMQLIPVCVKMEYVNVKRV